MDRPSAFTKNFLLKAKNSKLLSYLNSLYFLYFRLIFSILNQPLLFIFQEFSLSFIRIFMLFVVFVFRKILISFMNLFTKLFFLFLRKSSSTFFTCRKNYLKKFIRKRFISFICFQKLTLPYELRRLNELYIYMFYELLKST